MNYLSKRYEKGVEEVSKWMKTHHRYLTLSGPSGLREAQADLSKMQKECGEGSPA